MTTPQVKESKKFMLGLDKIFLKMANMAHKKEVIQKTPEELERLIHIEKKESQAQQFIDLKLWEHYFKMLNNGYVPTPKQEEKINKDLQLTLDSTNEKWNFFKNIVDFSYKPTNEIIVTLFAKGVIEPELLKGNNLKEHIIELQQLSYDNTSEYYQVILDTVGKKEFSTHCVNLFLDNTFAAIEMVSCNKGNVDFRFLFDEIIDYVKEVQFLLNTFPEQICQTLPLEKFLDNFSGLKNCVKEFKNVDNINTNKLLDFLQTIFEDTLHFYSDSLEVLHNETKVVYSEQYLNSQILETNNNLSAHLKLEHLPNNTQKIISQIQLQYKQLQIDFKELAVDNQFIVNNIFEKRVPEVLQKYLSIPEEYKLHTNLEGKNAEELMNETLINYSKKLESYLNLVNESKIKDLSVIKRYSKSI